MGRGKSWTSIEDVIARKAYIHVSENARTENHQIKEAFEAQIEEHYADLVLKYYDEGEGLLPLESRPGCSIRQSFKDIKAAFLKMKSNVRQVDAAMTGNTTDVDRRGVSTAIYKGEVNSTADMYIYCPPDLVEPNRSFQYPESWKFLSSTRLSLSIDEVTTKAEKQKEPQKKKAEPIALEYDDEKILNE